MANIYIADMHCLDENGNILYNYTQWDAGQTLRVSISDLKKINPDNPPMVHFCNKCSDKAYVAYASISDDKKILTAPIPNILLTKPYPILVFLYNLKAPVGKTVYKLSIPVEPRVKPDDYIYEDNSVLFFEQLQEDINEHKNAKVLDHPDGSVTKDKLANGAVTENKMDSALLNDLSRKNHTHYEFTNDLKISDKHTLTAYKIMGNDGLHLWAGPVRGESGKYAAIDFNVDPENDNDDVCIYISGAKLKAENFEFTGGGKIHKATTFVGGISLLDNSTSHTIKPDEDLKYNLGSKGGTNGNNNFRYKTIYAETANVDGLAGNVFKNQLDLKYLTKTTTYYDKNPISTDESGNPIKSVEMIEKPVYFSRSVIHNGDLFTHKILPELPDKQYTIGMANIPYYGGYFKNVYANGLYHIDGTPYEFNGEVGDIIDLTDATGILSIVHGGTGASTALQARTNLGLKNAATKDWTSYISSENSNLPTSDAVYKEIQRVKSELESDDTIIRESISNNSDEITLLRSDYENQIETLYDIINGLQERIETLEDNPSKPSTVTYYVRHYRQEADTGEYTLYTTDTKTGNDGALVSAAFNSYPNYKSNEGKSKKQGTLSSGSTLYLDLYYDLVTYTVAYNLDGGTGASGVSYASENVRHGARITLKTAPTKPNFVFKNWSSDSAVYTSTDNDYFSYDI